MLDSVYVIGNKVLAQKLNSTVQTGALRTSQQNGKAREADNALKNGCIEVVDPELGPWYEKAVHAVNYGDDETGSVPTPEIISKAVHPVNWKSPLDERSIKYSKVNEPIDMLGSDFFVNKEGKFVYQLQRWQNSLCSIVESLLDDDTMDGVARRVQQVISFRYENRFHPEALRKLEMLLDLQDFHREKAHAHSMAGGESILAGHTDGIVEDAESLLHPKPSTSGRWFRSAGYAPSHVRILAAPSAVPATKSAIEPHVQKSRFTAVTKSELLDDHHHVQSAAPATKIAFRSKTAPIPCTCHENLEHQNTRFPLRLPRKVITMCENAHGTTTEAQSLEAPAADTQILRARAVEMHMDDVARHECTVNSNELAGHGRDAQRSKHTCFSTTVRTLSVPTLLGEL